LDYIDRAVCAAEPAVSLYVNAMLEIA